MPIVFFQVGVGVIASRPVAPSPPSPSLVVKSRHSPLPPLDTDGIFNLRLQNENKAVDYSAPIPTKRAKAHRAFHTDELSFQKESKKVGPGLIVTKATPSGVVIFIASNFPAVGKYE